MRSWTSRPLVWVALAVVLVAALGVLAGQRYGGRDLAREADGLTRLLAIQPGDTVAEIGAGDGSLSLLMARRVGPAGRLYSTELAPEKLDAIGRRVLAGGAGNIEVIPSAELETNLPPASCDAIYMRNVYHHFRDTRAMNESLMDSLKPAGRLAVIDFPPGGWRRLLPGVPEAPASRGGHGIAADALVAELREAGFEIVDRNNHWTWTYFCVVARKPKAHGAHNPN